MPPSARRLLVASALALVCAGTSRATRAGLPSPPVQQWEFVTATRSPSAPIPTSPVVVQLTDDDGNGLIDAGDVPDVAFVTKEDRILGATFLHAVHGNDGSTIFSIPTLTGAWSDVAAGDLDGDGVAEVAVRDATGILTFEHDGRTGPRYEIGQPIRGQIAIADLVGDGRPELTDRVANHLDSCPDDANPRQEDTDGDGIGDACDP